MHRAFLLILAIALWSSGAIAQTQPGSVGGTVGRQNKSISGDVEQPTIPKSPYKGRPQKSEQRRRETNQPRNGPAKVPDAAQRCPLPEGSFSSAVATFGCALKNNVKTYAECIRYARAHGYTQGEIDTYCPLLPR
jgi:hypothetical protein